MKRLFKSTNVAVKLITMAFYFWINHLVYAQNAVAVVSAVKGNVFCSYKGKTLALRPGMYLESGTEVFAEEGAQLSLNDYYNHIYHLSGSGHMAMFKNLLELKRGYLWIQSLDHDSTMPSFKITTANTHVGYREGEAILSFDNYSGKTQLLVIAGIFEFENSLQSHLKVDVSEGQFSFIQDEHRGGSPRQPTPIGFDSYKKVTKLFDEIQPLSESKGKNHQLARVWLKSPRRSMASTPSKGDAFEDGLQKKGRRKNSNKRLESALLKHYRAKIKKWVKPRRKKRRSPVNSLYSRKSNVILNIFGQGRKGVKNRVFSQRPQVVKKETLRGIASVDKGGASTLRLQSQELSRVKKMESLKKVNNHELMAQSKKESTPKVEKKIVKTKQVEAWKKYYGRTPASLGGMVPKVKGNSSFEKGLESQYSKQRRHEAEVNALIDELKSVEMDYKKDY